MKKLTLLLILLATMLFTVGCIGNLLNSQGNMGKIAAVEMKNLEQINSSLQKNPVFIKMGAKWCPHCRSMKPMLEKLATEYQGNATIAAIDIDQCPEITKYFEVKEIPDSFVIVEIKNGTYAYMQENGTISMNRSQAKLIGYNETAGPNEETFKNLLNLSIIQREQGKPK